MTAKTPGERLRQLRRNKRISAEELGRRAAQVLGRDKAISPSAVRNQENGTNGIPIDTVDAYASILGVTPAHILWGTDGPIDVEAADPSEDDAVVADRWRHVEIEANKLVSGNWHPYMFNTGRPDEENAIFVGVPGWSADEDKLRAYEVLDTSLEPVYRRGTFLICVMATDAVVHTGAHVVVSKWRGSEIVQAVRQVEATPNNVHLFPVGATKDSNILLATDGEFAENVWIDEVVIASFYIDRPRGRPIQIPAPDYKDVPDIADDEDRAAVMRRVRKNWREEHPDEPEHDEDYEGVPLASGDADGE